jgi:hypothetical protein
MKFLMLLIVTVVGGGGPRPPVKRYGPPKLVNSTIMVGRYAKSGMKVVAKSDDERLRVHLRPGVYEIEAVLHDALPGTTQHLPNCESKRIRLRRRRRTRRLKIFCSIK